MPDNFPCDAPDGVVAGSALFASPKNTRFGEPFPCEHHVDDAKEGRHEAGCRSSPVRSQGARSPARASARRPSPPRAIRAPEPCSEGQPCRPRRHARHRWFPHPRPARYEKGKGARRNPPGQNNVCGGRARQADQERRLRPYRSERRPHNGAETSWAIEKDAMIHPMTSGVARSSSA